MSGVQHADLPDGVREDARAAVREIVAIDRRDDGVLQPHRLHRFGDTARLVEIERDGLAVRDRAVRARARADVAENHEGGGAVVPALADVGAVRVFTDRVELEAAHDVAQPEIVFRSRRAHFQPLGFRLAWPHEPQTALQSLLSVYLPVMASLAITWLGHSSFVLKTPGGKTVLLDPWYTGNPSFPEHAKPKQADVILVSHGHSDHITDAAAMAKATGATVVGIWEVTSWLGTKGVQNLEPMNKGGTIEVKGLRVTMTEARAQQQLRRQRHRVSGRTCRLCGEARKRSVAVFRRRYRALRRHEADWRVVQTRHRVPAHRRSVHDGTRHRSDGREMAGREAGRADALRDVSRCSPARPRN